MTKTKTIIIIIIARTKTKNARIDKNTYTVQIEDPPGVGEEEADTPRFHVLLHTLQLHHTPRYQGRAHGHRQEERSRGHTLHQDIRQPAGTCVVLYARVLPLLLLPLFGFDLRLARRRRRLLLFSCPTAISRFPSRAYFSPPVPSLSLRRSSDERTNERSIEQRRRPSDSRPCTASFATGWSRRTSSTRA